MPEVTTARTQEAKALKATRGVMLTPMMTVVDAPDLNESTRTANGTARAPASALDTPMGTSTHARRGRHRLAVAGTA